MNRDAEQPTSRRVQIDDVVVPVDHARRAPDDASIERMSHSLAEVGLLMPIGVTPATVLIFGSIRLEAARRLGWEYIEARVFESAEDPEARRWMAWEENDARRPLSLEEQLAFKREMLDPMLEQRRHTQRRATAASLNQRRWGMHVEPGKLPASTMRATGVADAPDLTPARAIGAASGESRTVISRHLDVSARTIEKFEQLARWSEDAALPEAIRDEATRAREHANALGKVDGDYKRIRALVDAGHAEPRAESVAIEHQLTRVFSNLEKLLDEHPARSVAGGLSTGGWRGIASALHRALEWGREVKATRDDPDA